MAAAAWVAWAVWATTTSHVGRGDRRSPPLKGRTGDLRSPQGGLPVVDIKTNRQPPIYLINGIQWSGARRATGIQTPKPPHRGVRPS